MKQLTPSFRTQRSGVRNLLRIEVSGDFSVARTSLPEASSGQALRNDGAGVFIFLTVLLFLTSCTSTKQFNPSKKYSPQELREDYVLFRNILEENHPSLYWYTTKDSLNNYFDDGYARIKDSMTEPKFKTLLSFVIAKIKCGHTTVHHSKKFNAYKKKVQQKRFPLSMKLWEDTAVVTYNLNRKDTVLKKGMVIRAIDGRPFSFYRDSLFTFISSDGYNKTFPYQTLSNNTTFSDLYRETFGLKDSFAITYSGDSIPEQTITIPVFDPGKKTVIDKPSVKKTEKPSPSRMPRQRENYLQIGTKDKTGLLTLGTFSNGNHYHHLIKNTFKKLEKYHIPNLIIDIRGNGGGTINNVIQLTKYIAGKKFKMTDSLYAINKRSRNGKYIHHYFYNKWMITFLAGKRKDNFYHFGYLERHYFKPKRKHHFNGHVYIITGGYSFSAAAVFASTLKGMKNVTVVGEETGGGSYGNSATIIPDVTLPNTKIRFRLPLFRMVLNKDYPKTGRGVFPDVEARPTLTDIRNGIDPKLSKAFELIRNK